MPGFPSSTRRPVVVATLLALSLVAAACGGGDDVETADPAAGEDEMAETAETAPTPDGPVLDASVFSGQATTVDGASFDLGPLANQDLIVWFWAPW